MPLQPAMLGTARLGNFRLGYQSAALAARRATTVRITIAGVDAATRSAARRVRRDGLSIHDALHEAPNTCSLTVQGTAPSVDQDLRVSVNSDDPVLLFNGTLQTTELTYEGRPSQLAYPCTAVDDTARLNRIRPFGTWTNVSATTIAQSLIATFAPGFTSTHVEASLPLVSITFDGTEDFATCLARLATAIGGNTYWEDLDLHLFVTPEAGTMPDDIDHTPGRLLHDPPIRMTIDSSHRRTRVYGKGHGEATLCDLAIGETIVPIADAVMFNPAGGQAMAGTTPDSAQSQKLTYTGVQLGGGGTLVGPGASASAAPAAARSAGAGLGLGAYQYAYTYVTAAGESLPSPVGLVTTGSIDPPATPPQPNGGAPGGSLQNFFYGYAVTFVTATGETLVGPVGVHHGATNYTLFLINLALGPSSVTQRKLYRTVAQTTQAAAEIAALKLVTTIADNTTTVYNDSLADGGLGATAPVTNTAQAQQVAVTGIAVGGAGVTSRKVYRTAVAGSQLKLLTTIADNTTTVYTDAAADGTLGANVPITDTSAILQPDGQALPGTSTLVIASPAAFSAAGGWAIIGNGEQVIRYTGFGAGTLTGIPVAGAGAIVAAVGYNSTITAAPALIGVTGGLLAMQKGATVHVWVQRDDLAAQADLIALDLAQGRVSTGVVEWTIVDGRRGEASLIALCEVHLQMFSRPLVTVAYATRDLKTKSGKPVTFNLTTPPIAATLTIQDVTITEIDQYPATAPRFAVTASSVRFSLEALLRHMSAQIGAA